MLAEAIRNGVEPPEHLEPGVLIRVRPHIFAGPSNGKTWLALHLMSNAIERERRSRSSTPEWSADHRERLTELGVDPAW